MAVSNAVQKPDELVQLVDRQGNDVGTARRGRMRAENLLHRASAVLIFNSKVPRGLLAHYLLQNTVHAIRALCCVLLHVEGAVVQAWDVDLDCI